jgi:A/G-specific adenine glycosylase
MNFERYLAKLDALIDAQRLTPSAFQRLIMSFYRDNARPFPWRETRDPYRVLVSEIMLQQTQTSRVEERYPRFLRLFPTVKALALAPQADVLRAWEGLGYYRRARNLHRAAIAVQEQYGGTIPENFDDLVALPGLGRYTAAAVSVFAFDRPTPMIETNIRSVYLYAFCRGRSAVLDAELLQLVQDTIDVARCRDWFYALMDFGVVLKRARPGINSQSKHHTKQSRFEGSDRQIAARVLKAIVSAKRGAGIEDLYEVVQGAGERIDKAIVRLERDGMIRRMRSGRWCVAEA